MEKIKYIISNNFSGLFSDKMLLKKIGIITGSLLTIILINIFIAKNLVGGDYFFSIWKTTQLTFSENYGPYSISAQNIINLEVEKIGYISNNKYNLPFLTLFIVAPFSLIRDFEIARALWMTFLQGCIYFSIIFFSEYFYKKEKIYINSIIPTVAIFTNIFVIPVIMQGFLTPLILFLSIYSFILLISGKDESGGIVASFLFIEPSVSILLISFLLIFAAVKRRWGYVIWFVIASALIFSVSLLISRDWILEFAKQSLNGSGLLIMENLKTIFPNQHLIIYYALLVIPSVIVIIETIRSIQMDIQNILIWNICLVFLLGILIYLRLDGSNFIFILPGILLIFNSWNENSTIGGKIMANFILWIFSFITFFRIISFPEFLAGNINITIGSLYLPIIFIVLNMYWVRLWLIRANQQSLINKY